MRVNTYRAVHNGRILGVNPPTPGQSDSNARHQATPSAPMTKRHDLPAPDVAARTGAVPTGPQASTAQGSTAQGAPQQRSAQQRPTRVGAPQPSTAQQPAVAPTARPSAVPRAQQRSEASSGGAIETVPQATVSRRAMTGRKRRFEARRVHRIIRHIDPWSVLKLSLVFFLCIWVIFMVAIVIVWSIAQSSGTIGKIEDLLAELDITNSGFDGTFIFRQYGLFGLVMVFASTIATTVGSIVFNLVSDLIGGIWITVIEEETSRPAAD